MRTHFIVLALACAGTASFAPQPARAQASVDQRALEPLAQQPAAPTPVKPAPAKPTPPARPAPSRPAARPATPAAPPPPPQVQVPLTAPPAPVLPPPVIVPTRPPAPPPPVAITADAPGIVEQIPDGIRVTFGENRTDLNPATETALRTLAHAAPADASFTVTAFATGVPDDPSTPRRLSLSRALAVRSVLIAEGIASVRIYVKAFGGGHEAADGPADRADITVAATKPQAKPPQ